MCGTCMWAHPPGAYMGPATRECASTDGSSDARPFVERMACIIESFFVSGPGTERLWSTQSDGSGNHLGPGSAIFIVAEDSPMRRLD